MRVRVRVSMRDRDRVRVRVRVSVIGPPGRARPEDGDLLAAAEPLAEPARPLVILRLRRHGCSARGEARRQLEARLVRVRVRVRVRARVGV